MQLTLIADKRKSYLKGTEGQRKFGWENISASSFSGEPAGRVLLGDFGKNNKGLQLLHIYTVCMVFSFFSAYSSLVEERTKRPSEKLHQEKVFCKNLKEEKGVSAQCSLWRTEGGRESAAGNRGGALGRGRGRQRPRAHRRPLRKTRGALLLGK